MKEIKPTAAESTDTFPGAGSINDITNTEHRYASMLQDSPFMVAILEGKELVIKNANDAILKLWNKSKTIIGKPLAIGLPEAVEVGSIVTLKKVYETGEPFHGYEVPYTRQGDNDIRYFTFVYQAQKNISGQIDGVAIIAQEVTPQAVLNKKIKESEERFQAAVSAVQGIIWTNNARGEMEGEQPAWAALTGQSFYEYQGYGWASVVHPDDAAASVIAWQEAVNTQTTFIFEHRVKVKDGTWRTFSIRAIPLKKEDGSIREWVGVHTDVTEKRKAENSLKESEERFRTMAESSDILIGVNDETIDAVYFNKSWEKLTGRPVDALLKLGWADLLHPEDKEPFMNKFLTAFKNRASYDGEYRILNKDGGYSWLYSKVQVRLNPDGSYAGHISTSIDITERRKNESALIESELKVRSVIENSPFPIGVYVGKDLIIEFANQSIIDIFGKGNDVIGKSYRQLLPELKNQQIFEQLDAVLETGIPFHAKNQRVDLVIDGMLQPYYFNYSFTPLYNAAGEIYAVMNTAAEVTDIVLAKQKVEQSQKLFRELADQAPMWVC
jgi:PAS domain S-box-containing protein